MLKCKVFFSEKDFKSIPVHLDKAEFSGFAWASSFTMNVFFSPFFQGNKATLYGHAHLIRNQTQNLQWCRTDCCCPSSVSENFRGTAVFREKMEGCC